MRIVVVSPHRDDAAFSLGLSIEHWLRAGHRVDVLNCFTQSEYAPYSDAEMLHSNDRLSFVSALRKREDAAWNKLLGGKLRFTDFDLLDAPLRLACSVEEVFNVSIRPGDRAVSRVAGAIAKLARAAQTSELAIVLPLAIGGHIDHRVARQAGLEALARNELPVSFYEDLPYAAGLAEANEIERAAESAEVDAQPTFATVGSTDVTVQVQRKLRMCECYDSQVDSEVVERIARFCEGYEGRERLWGNQPWRGSVLSAPGENLRS